MESYALRFLEYGLDNCMCPGELTEENAVGEASMDAFVDRVVEPPTNIPMNIPIDSSGNPVMETTLPKAEQAIPLLPEPRGADFTAENPLGKKILDNRNCFFFTVGVIALVFFIMHLGKMNTLDIFLQCIRLSPLAFFALSFMLAVSPFFLGLLDTAIAVFFYCQRNPAVEVKLKEIPYIAKYGDSRRVVPGMGRYDLSPKLIIYSLGCNLFGAFSSMAFYIFLRSIPDFASYVGKGHFVPVANISLAFNMLVTFVHSFFLFTREPMHTFCASEENPDTKKMDRLHVIANSFHMIFNMTFNAIGILLVLVYGYMHGGDGTLLLSPGFAVALFFIYGFLWFSSCSPFAVEFNAECAGSFIIIFPIVFVLSTLYAILCFKAGLGTFLVHGVNVVVLVVWLLSFLKDRVRSIFPLMRMHRAYFLLYALLIFFFFLLAAHL